MGALGFVLLLSFGKEEVDGVAEGERAEWLFLLEECSFMEVEEGFFWLEEANRALGAGGDGFELGVIGVGVFGGEEGFLVAVVDVVVFFDLGFFKFHHGKASIVGFGLFVEQKSE